MQGPKYGMAYNEIRKQLLLAYVGAHSLEVNQHLFIARQLLSRDYSEVVGALSFA